MKLVNGEVRARKELGGVGGKNQNQTILYGKMFNKRMGEDIFI